MYVKAAVKPVLVALALGAGAGAAQALPPLAENPRVKSEFFAAAVGDEIRKNCPDISARMFRVLGMAKKLEAYAIELGYSRDDIRAMRDDDAEKAKLRALRDAYLDKHGVTAGDSASYCRLGLQEIEKNTLTGWLLRAN